MRLSLKTDVPRQAAAHLAPIWSQIPPPPPRHLRCAPPESSDGLLHVLFLLLRKPRINSQLVAQQVAQQYTMPPPAKKDRRERSERTDKERLDSEGERACGEGRPVLERPETVKPEEDTPEKDKGDKEPPLKDKPDREKDISPALPKKPSSKKIRWVSLSELSVTVCCWHPHPSSSPPPIPPDRNQTAIRAPPATNRAYSLGNQQPRPTRTPTFPGG